MPLYRVPLFGLNGNGYPPGALRRCQGAVPCCICSIKRCATASLKDCFSIRVKVLPALLSVFQRKCVLNKGAHLLRLGGVSGLQNPVTSCIFWVHWWFTCVRCSCCESCVCSCSRLSWLTAWSRRATS